MSQDVFQSGAEGRLTFDARCDLSAILCFCLSILEEKLINKCPRTGAFIAFKKSYCRDRLRELDTTAPLILA